jgi:hypothetical protein
MFGLDVPRGCNNCGKHVAAKQNKGNSCCQGNCTLAAAFSDAMHGTMQCSFA